jgi:hypothetical protein
MGADGPDNRRGSLYVRSVVVVGTTLWREGILGGIDVWVNPNRDEMKLRTSRLVQSANSARFAALSLRRARDRMVS